MSKGALIKDNHYYLSFHNVISSIFLNWRHIFLGMLTDNVWQLWVAGYTRLVAYKEKSFHDKCVTLYGMERYCK